MTEQDNQEIKCIWTTGAPCDGDVSPQLMFDGQMSVPICCRHMSEHQEILFLNARGDCDIEEITDMSSEERHKIFLELREKFPDDELKT